MAPLTLTTCCLLRTSFIGRPSSQFIFGVRRGRSLSSKSNNSNSNAFSNSNIGSSSSLSSVYVHPLSQIVLQYLQNECHDWICAQRLDRNLQLHRDGTFLLEQYQQEEGDINTNLTTSRPTSTQQLRIWTYYDLADKKHWLSCHSSVLSSDATNKNDDDVGTDDDDDEHIPSSSASSSTAVTTTSGSSHHRFLLQDNMMPAWHGNNRRQSLAERIQESVRELILVAEQDISAAAATRSTPTSTSATAANKKRG